MEDNRLSGRNKPTVQSQGVWLRAHGMSIHKLYTFFQTMLCTSA